MVRILNRGADQTERWIKTGVYLVNAEQLPALKTQTELINLSMVNHHLVERNI